MLARWEHASQTSALRFQSFSPGQTLTREEIVTLLPITAAASTTLDITVPPYSAPVSPADATSAIQSALDAARSLAHPGAPVDVVIPSGTYDHSRVLEVGPDVRLRGAGGWLNATDPAAAAVHLAGDRSAALFLSLRAQATRRLTTSESCGIWVGPRSSAGSPVHDTLVIGNEVVGPAGAHILAIAEEGGLWAFNYAHDGFADTFHHTGGSSDCQVVGNRASGPGDRGDDLYAFVGYRHDGDPVHHCSCIANWGRDGNARGLSAVGAGFIAFERNDISRTRWAGIYVAREHAFDTYGSFSILVSGNDISFSNLGGSHGGLLAYADSPSEENPSRTFGSIPNAVRDLTVKDNVFSNIAAGHGGGLGIAVRSSCAGGEVTGNTVRGATSPGVRVAGTGFVVSTNTVMGEAENPR